MFKSLWRSLGIEAGRGSPRSSQKNCIGAGGQVAYDRSDSPFSSESPGVSTRTPSPDLSYEDQQERSALADSLDLGHEKPSPSAELRLEQKIKIVEQQGKTPEYSRRDQTIIFFDWDDTLFATHEITTRWGHGHALERPQPLPFEQREAMREWEMALLGQLEEAGRLALRCVILSNSVRPWVHCCIQEYAPRVSMLLKTQPQTYDIIYAGEHLPDELKNSDGRTTAKELTSAKYVAMKATISQFYSQYENQTWKNIINFGDMPYEHDALTILKLNRVPPSNKREHMRIKNLMLPSKPSLAELTLRLRVCMVLLPAFCIANHDLMLDLRSCSDPSAEIAGALNLSDISVPRSVFNRAFGARAFGAEGDSDSDDEEHDLLAIVNTVYKSEPLRSYSGFFNLKKHSPTRTLQSL